MGTPLLSRTLNVEVGVENPVGKLLPGSYAFVHIPIPGAAGGFEIPSTALIFRAQGLRVGVVRNGRAQLVPIAIGRDYGASVEVASGIALLALSGCMSACFGLRSRLPRACRR